MTVDYLVNWFSSMGDFPALFFLLAALISAIPMFLFMAIYQELDNIIAYFAASGLITLVLNILVVVVAYFLCGTFNIGPEQKKTILIETGLQNGTLAIVVAGLILMTLFIWFP